MAGIESSSGRPRIGLTTYWQEASWGVWQSTAALIPGSYVKAITTAGGTPLLLPPVGSDPTVVDVLDGVVIIGGPDVDPRRYEATAHEKTVSQPQRDEHDAAILKAALQRGVPVLAICRGAQLLNVEFGGSLNQHLPELLPEAEYQPAPGVFGQVQFETVAHSAAARIFGGTGEASCYHHQSMDRIGAGLAVTACAADGTVEVLERAADSAGRGWLLGVQFHPEEDAPDPNSRAAALFKEFVNAAATFASGQGEAANQPSPSLQESS